MCDKRHIRPLRSIRLSDVAEVEVEVKCIFCGEKVNKITPRVRAGGERVQRYQCKVCGRYFQETYASVDEYYRTTTNNEYTVVEI
jgi:transposase-like protein